MKRAVPAILAVALLIAGRAAADGEVQAKLLADSASIRPGKAFRIGVRFDIKPDWHIYWINPGEAGLATDVRFKAPPGFVVGPLLWPVPERFVMPGDIVSYGYERSVLLFAEVSVPEKIEGTGPVVFEADASWLRCKDICVPGEQALKLELPIGTGEPGPDHPLFEASAARLPLKPESKNAPFRAVHPAAERTGGNAVRAGLTLEWAGKVAPVEVFPNPPPGVLVGAAEVTNGEQTTAIVLPVKIDDPKLTGPIEVPFLIVFKDANGRTAAVELSIRVQ